MDASLPKSQRLCGKTAVAAVFGQGKSLSAGCLRCKFLVSATPSALGTSVPLASASALSAPARVMVSVPKRHFKRAVKRNLLKRRIRESYRRQKHLLPPGLDVLFMYTATEVLPYETIYANMTAALTAIASACAAARFPESADNQCVE